MTLKDIAVKNLLRRKSKAVFVFAGLLIGVATVVVVISLVDGMTRDINEKLDKYGANILMMPKTENLALTYGGLSIGGVSFDIEEIPEAELSKIKTIKNAANIAAVGPIVLGAVKVENKNVLLAGVDFSQCKILKPWWNLKDKPPAENNVVLGYDSAKVLNKTKGSRLDINGRTMAVSEVLNQTGSQDDRIIFADLKKAQSLLGKQGKISMVEVAALCSACPVEDMSKQISAVIPGANVMPIRQVVKGRMETLQQFKKFSYGVSLVVLLIGSMVVLVTMMGSVKERTAEIGILRAIGYRKSHVMKIILLEAGILSGIAGLFGYLLGLGATKIIIRFFSENSTAELSLNAGIAIGAILLALVMGTASSIYPARLAAGLDPGEALRSL
jgi:putative ABC transport system permease protein